MGVEQTSEQNSTTVMQGKGRVPFTGAIIGGSFMAPHPERTAEERRADAKLVDRIVRHMS